MFSARTSAPVTTHELQTNTGISHATRGEKYTAGGGPRAGLRACRLEGRGQLLGLNGTQAQNFSASVVCSACWGNVLAGQAHADGRGERRGVHALFRIRVIIREYKTGPWICHGAGATLGRCSAVSL